MCVFLCRRNNCPFISTFPSLQRLFAVLGNKTNNNVLLNLKTKKREYAEKVLFFVYGAASN